MEWEGADSHVTCNHVPVSHTETLISSLLSPETSITTALVSSSVPQAVDWDGDLH